jgi:predicted glycosyltransferase
MLYAFDIIHPAHVHFFANTIRKLVDRGDSVKIFSRKKELVCELLDYYGFEHKILSSAMSGIAGLFLEMILHQGRLLKEIIHEKPSVIAALGGPLCTHVSRLRKCPVAIFTDTHIAFMQNLLTFPFADRIFVPQCYPGPFYGFEQKFTKYPGYHELAYSHPNYFTPNIQIKEKLGLQPDEAFFVVRFTAWKSSHDFATSGLNPDQKQLIIHELLKYGKVFISSENPLTGNLEKYIYPLPGYTMHDALAFASMVVGESATMVSEAAVLGTPGIFISPVSRCYTDDQEVNYNLVKTINPNRVDDIISVIRNWHNGREFQNIAENHRKLIESNIDVTDFILSSLTAMAK